MKLLQLWTIEPKTARNFQELEITLPLTYKIFLDVYAKTIWNHHSQNIFGQTAIVGCSLIRFTNPKDWLWFWMAVVLC